MSNLNSKIRATTIIILSTVLCAVFPNKALSAEESGVNFDRYYHEDNVNMTLQGTGLKRVVFFKAFVAGLYRDPLNTADILGEVSKRIEVEYFVNIPGKKLSQFTVDT
ncbi:MAG: chalcone isomerase family protein, partial [Anaerolineae bacterium]|nr:chalcone isomerase family protein [Anaerolineae bacterium]